MQRAMSIAGAQVPWIERVLELLASGGHSFLVSVMDRGWRHCEESNFAAVAELRMSIEAEECSLGPAVDLTQYQLCDLYAMLGGWIHERWEAVVPARIRRTIVSLCCQPNTGSRAHARQIRQCLAAPEIPAEAISLIRRLVSALAKCATGLSGVSPGTMQKLSVHASGMATSPLMLRRVDSRNFISVVDLVAPLLFTSDCVNQERAVSVSGEDAQISLRTLMDFREDCFASPPSSSDSSPHVTAVDSLQLQRRSLAVDRNVSPTNSDAKMSGIRQPAASSQADPVGVGAVEGQVLPRAGVASLSLPVPETPQSPPKRTPSPPTPPSPRKPPAGLAIRRLEQQVRDLRSELSRFQQRTKEQAAQHAEEACGFDFWINLLLSESSKQLKMQKTSWNRLERRVVACEARLSSLKLPERDESGPNDPSTSCEDDQLLELFRTATGASEDQMQTNPCEERVRVFHYAGREG